jgi:uncharacterized protein
MHARCAELITLLALQPHPEGGFYREVFRSPQHVQGSAGGAVRSAVTTIDFLLPGGQFSAWHRVASDEIWHLVEGGPLRLWLMPPSLARVESIELAAVDAQRRPRAVVPAQWWQAAEPTGDENAYALCAATVAPGFEFADFTFLRSDAQASAAIDRLQPDAARLK